MFGLSIKERLNGIAALWSVYVTTKNKVIATVVAALFFFALGRWSAPEKIKIEKETITIEAERLDNKTHVRIDENRNITIVEITKPDGTKIKKKTIIIDKNSDTRDEASKDTTVTTLTKETKTITKGSKVTISALGGLHLTNIKGPVVYGGHISRPILGPVTVGIFGLSNGIVGMSIGLQF